AAAVVGPQSLGGRKTFARRNVAAELRVSCATYGRPVADLTRAVNRVLADPEAILLVGVAGAIEQPYASAAVLAAEQAVAVAAAAQTPRSDAPKVSAWVAGAAIVAKGRELGRPLTAGQVAAVQGICTSGRGLEYVEGYAGTGK